MRRYLIILAFFSSIALSQYPTMDHILYGAEYYYEYMPFDRLDKDIELIKKSGLNTVRIGESTWSSFEPSEGKFEFAWFDRVLDAMYKANIKVIVGTPTYAIPQWLANKYPDIMVKTLSAGQSEYGSRQNMDITHPAYRQYGERIIRQVVAHCKDHPAVIGYQLDNETKSYQTASERAKKMFVEFLKKKYLTIDSFNKSLNMAYWSHKISNWDELHMTNAEAVKGLAWEWKRFQRSLASDMLKWEHDIVNQYKRPGQFITQNFDFYWTEKFSTGPQPEVDHFDAAQYVDIIGVDIYHPLEDEFDGRIISYCGDEARSIKHNNYLCLESAAQTASWTPSGCFPPYDGQIRQCFYSHLACGANMVQYWPWQSIHNGGENYVKGVIGHDFEPNRIFYEIQKTASESKAIEDHLINLKKKNRVAILYSIDAQNGCDVLEFSKKYTYAHALVHFYNAMYRQNIEMDIIIPESNNWSDYKIIIIPVLYVASDQLLNKINEYINNGGHVIMSFLSGARDDHYTIRTIRLPGILREACGFSYQEYSGITGIQGLKNSTLAVAAEDNNVSEFMEFLIPEKCHPLAYYDHPYWGKYAAITENNYGKGSLTYIGAYPSLPLLEAVYMHVLKNLNMVTPDQLLHFPMITKKGTNQYNKTIHYYFNYSNHDQKFNYPYQQGSSLMDQKMIMPNQELVIKPWDLKIIEENK